MWLEGDLEILSRCDAVLCVSNWRYSQGAINERAIARKLGLPVFETFEEFLDWHNRHPKVRQIT